MAATNNLRLLTVNWSDVEEGGWLPVNGMNQDSHGGVQYVRTQRLDHVL